MAAWLSPMKRQLRLCLAGPALSQFRARLGTIDLTTQTLHEALHGTSVLISGTGWASDLEHRARLLARELSIPSVAVLDHWVNYRTRFQHEGLEILPDQLWVADAEAAAIARTEFPRLPVVQLPNHWLEGVCTEVRTRRNSDTADQPPQPRRPARRLLYLLEPIRVPWPTTEVTSRIHGAEPGELQGLRYWMKQLPKLAEQGWIAPPEQLEALALRPHPSEPAGKYNALIAEAERRWPIRLDPSPSLAAALAWADAAFGCETQALVAALACGLHAFSTVPPWAPPCRLPHAALHHLSRLEEP